MTVDTGLYWMIKCDDWWVALVRESTVVTGLHVEYSNGKYAAKKFYSYSQACKVASACDGEVVKGEAL